MGDKDIEKLKAEIAAISEGLAFILGRLNEIEEIYQQGQSETWDPSRIKWDHTEGPSGPYEKASKQNGKDYDLMIKDLQDHKGRLTNDSFFYWLFEDGATVGRKSRK